jgi:hypothetical protein
MRSVRRIALLVVVAALCLVSSQMTAGAPLPTLDAVGVLTLQQGVNGYTGNTHATLDSWKPDVNAASPTGAVYLRTYVTNGITRFDLSALPTNAYVTQATLRIFIIDRTNGANINLRFYRLLRPWQTNQVTWHEASSGVVWERPGANDVYIDRSGAFGASVAITTTTGFYDIDLTSLVRDWVRNPATNYGALIVPTGESSVLYRMAAENFMVAGSRPKLTVAYSIDAANDFPPNITLTSPQHDSFVTGSVLLSANAEDDRGIQHVRYLLDGALLAQVAAPPYHYTLDTSGLRLGRHGLTARVTDTAGQTRDHPILFNVYRTDSGILTFAHVSDTHLGTPWEGEPKDPAQYLQRFQQALVELRDIVQPAVIINTGDSTNVGDAYSWGLYNSAIATTTIPVRAIPGNHDLADRENFLNFVGKTRFSFDIAQNRFVGFTTRELDTAWLNGLLSSTTNKGIIFSHYILRLPQGATSPAWFYTLPATEVNALQQAMLTHGAAAYLSGHYHEAFVFEDTVSHAVEIGAPSLGQKSSYVIATSDNGIVSSIVHYLGDWPAVVISSPQQFYADGGSRTISGVVAIRAKVYGPSPLASVTYAIDGAGRGEMTPLGGNVFQAMWDTSAMPAGNHQITVSARDTAGRLRSSAITVRTVAAPPGAGTPSPTPTSTRVPGPYSVFSNCGGPDYADSEGNLWQADHPFVTGDWGYDGLTASTGSTANAIANTGDDPLYQTDRRWASTEGTARYRFVVPNGRYEVSLLFAESEATQVGQRVFDIRVEGNTLWPSYDIFLDAGAHRAVIKKTVVDVDDGQINIVLRPIIGQPKINAIAIRDIRLTDPAATPTRTATATLPGPSATPTATRTPTRTPTVINTAPPTATLTPSPTRTATPSSVATTRTATATARAGYQRRVNAGGAAYLDSQGNTWSADQPYTAGGWGYVGGGAYSAASAIGGTDDDPLYQSEHWGMSSYAFSVPNGAYDIELHFAEIYCSYSSCRSFDVSIENTVVLSALNLYSVAGRNNAYVRTFQATVNDGVLNIGFTARIGSAKVSAIAVWSQEAPAATATPTASGAPAGPLRVNCGGPSYNDSLGNTWQADQPFVSGAWGFDGASAGSGATSIAIAGTSDMALYQTDRRWASNEGTPRYRFTVANGAYEVTLHFAESEATQPGQRVFAIKIEGITVTANYDIFAAAGANTASTLTFNVTVNDGLLNVVLPPVVGQPKVNAIEVKPLH